MYVMSKKTAEREAKKKSHEKQNQNRNGMPDKKNQWMQPVVQLQRQFVPVNAERFPQIKNAALPVSGNRKEQPEWYVKLGQYQFVSENEGIVGSLYFEKGRIRLLHESGPVIERNNTERYLISPEMQGKRNEEIATQLLTFNAEVEMREEDLGETKGGEEKVKKYREKRAKEDENIIGTMNTRWHLFELSSSGSGTHRSRGIGATLRFNLEEMEMLYQAVLSCQESGGTPVEQNKKLALALQPFWDRLGWNREYLYTMTKDENIRAQNKKLGRKQNF